MSIHSLAKYKESLALLPDIEFLIKVLTLTEGSLKYHTHYMPAAKVLFTVKDQKALLERYRDELEAIRTSKGKRV